MSTIVLHSTLNISETVRVRGLVSPTDHHGESNDHVTDDVKVKLVTPIRLEKYLENSWGLFSNNR